MSGKLSFLPRLPIPGGRDTSGSVPSKRTAPRTRRPHTIRDRFLKALPGSSGPYDVGSIDLEIPVEREEFGIIRDGKPLLVMETVLFTIFYPIKMGSGATVAPDGKKEWSRQLWLSSNRGRLSRGYGEFSGVPKPLCELFFVSTVGATKLPAWRNAPIADHFPAEGNIHDTGPEIRDQEAESHPPRRPCFLVMFFSHGLGGTRTTYSSICGEYASYGYVCCAIEHRDGSGPRTYVNYSDGRVPRRVDYIHPKDGNDTVNDSERSTDHELRDAQTTMRKREIEEVHKILKRINEGHGEAVASTNLRVKTPKHIIGGTSRGTIGVNWDEWKGCARVDTAVMCGHSFGAGTTVSVIRTPRMLKFIKYAVLLDPWGQGFPTKPLPDEVEDIGTSLVVMSSESFLYWEENIDILFKLCRKSVEAGHKFWLFTIRGTFHLSFSDFGVLWPRLFKLLFKTRIPAQRALDIIVNATLEYTREVMPPEINRWNRATDEGLLKTPISSKWRSVQGKRNAWREKMQHADSEDDDDDTEIWMHFSSSCDSSSADHDFSGIEHHRLAE